MKTQDDIRAGFQDTLERIEVLVKDGLVKKNATVADLYALSRDVVREGHYLRYLTHKIDLIDRQPEIANSLHGLAL